MDGNDDGQKRNLIIASAVIVVFVLFGIGAIKGFMSWTAKSREVQAQEQKKQERENRKKASSIQVTDTWNVGGDDYFGYIFFRLPYFEDALAARGQAINFVQDGGMYAERNKKFNDRELDAMVIPNAQYLEHGKKYGYPGLYTMGVSDSTGADVCLAFEDTVGKAGVKALNDASIKHVYVGHSPSSFLIDLMRTDQAMYNLSNTDTWRVEVEQIDDVVKAIDPSKRQVYWLWEPLASIVQQKYPKLKRVFGSEQLEGYTVDMLVVHSEVIAQRPDKLLQFTDAYMEAVAYYDSHPDEFYRDIELVAGIKPDIAKSIIENKRINFFDFEENCAKLFGLARRPGEPVTQMLAQGIHACSNVLVRTGVFEEKPLGSNVRSIIHDGTLRQLLQAKPEELGRRTDLLPQTWAALPEKDWAALEEVAVIGPVEFPPGSATLDKDGEIIVDEFAATLASYGHYYIEITGHTPAFPNETENVELSLLRALAVRQRLIQIHGFDKNRIRAVGLGSSKKLERPDLTPQDRYYHSMRCEFRLLKKSSSF